MESHGAKPTVLLCWGYHRSGWNEIFERLKDHFQFHYLFFFSPRLARGDAPDAPVHFWTDFPSGFDVLDGIKPGLIVFMGLDGLQTVSLNIAARNRRVPTLLLQHGLMLPFAETVAVKATLQPSDPFFRLSRREKLHQALFFLRSLTFLQIDALIFAVKWMVMRRHLGEQRALALNKSIHRRASFYAVYSRRGAEQLLIERDGVIPEQIVEIGHPGFDPFFATVGRSADDQGYELLIDQPISGGPEIPIALKTAEQVLKLHSRLARFCNERGSRLVIKLHPYSYASGPRLESNLVTYLEDVEDLPGLVQGSRAVYGFYSSLLLPCLCLRPCCLFDLGMDNSLQRDAREYGVAEVVPFDDLPSRDFHTRRKDSESVKAFIRTFLFRADGRSMERLRELLFRLGEIGSPR